jgi:hypothetical protein
MLVIERVNLVINPKHADNFNDIFSCKNLNVLNMNCCIMPGHSGVLVKLLGAYSFLCVNISTFESVC